ncbi:MAG: paraquat-inducible protein A [Planctomycetes bacterium]|nr:paraquat-inducible protein A [Planctomycetota bacterium]
MSAKAASAARLGLICCRACGLLLRARPLQAGAAARCPRCGAGARARKPRSVACTWALLVTGAILYVPANVYPIMQSELMGKTSEDTIISGVLRLMEEDQAPLALLVFFASIVVPLLKLCGLSFLLVSVQRRSTWQPRGRAALFRLIEIVGRWSMLDIFVVAILVALVRLGSVATILPGFGALSFAAVVVATMFATLAFDPRLIWDSLEKKP